MSKKLKHREHVLTYGEIHLHIMEAIDAIRTRWPNDTEDELIRRMVVTARRIMQNRRNGVAVVIRRGVDLID
jgi:hypothetical protein